MDHEKLYRILSETTVQLRKGEVLHGTPELVDAIQRGDDELPGGIATFDMMPHESEASDVEKIDMEFLTIGVNTAAAEKNRSALVGLLNDYPHPDRLAAGPSYIEAGAHIGDQGAAFQLFALGKVLKLWDVITPKMLGATGEQATQMAGAGYIMITGYQPRPS